MVVRHKCSEREKWVTQTNKTMLEHELQWQILLVHQFHLRTVLMSYCLPSSIHRLRTSWFDDCVVWFTPPSSYHPWFIDCYLTCIDCYLSIIYLFIVCWLCLFVIYGFCYNGWFDTMWGAISNLRYVGGAGGYYAYTWYSIFQSINQWLWLALANPGPIYGK